MADSPFTAFGAAPFNTQLDGSVIRLEGDTILSKFQAKPGDCGNSPTFRFLVEIFILKEPRLSREKAGGALFAWAAGAFSSDFVMRMMAWTNPKFVGCTVRSICS